MKLRAVRADRGAFDARFYERHPAFASVARAAATFRDEADWPPVARYDELFAGVGPVRFEEAPVKRKRPPGPVVRSDLYDATIVQRRVVPTRARMWHDYLNALVWASFPAAKLALHTRQHTAIERWIPVGATHLPNARTRELDALALVDEGGVLLAGGDPVLFGHALLEGLVLGQPAMVARAVVVPGATDLDAALAAILQDPSRVVSPDELPRAPIG